jgi:hypothetical protein
MNGQPTLAACATKYSDLYPHLVEALTEGGPDHGRSGVSLARLTHAQRATVDNLLARADARFDTAETAAKRPDAKPGEYDNNFDGVVSGIYHVLDAGRDAANRYCCVRQSDIRERPGMC